MKRLIIVFVLIMVVCATLMVIFHNAWVGIAGMLFGSVAVLLSAKLNSRCRHDFEIIFREDVTERKCTNCGESITSAPMDRDEVKKIVLEMVKKNRL